MITYIIETLNSGHGLSYPAFLRRTWDPDQTRTEFLFDPSLQDLTFPKAEFELRAREAGCGRMFLCTADSYLKKFTLESVINLKKSMPLSVILHNYYHLENPLRRYLWLRLLRLGYLENIYILDPYYLKKISANDPLAPYLKFVHFETGNEKIDSLSRSDACHNLQLKEAKCRFSVIGGLSVRKGLPTIVKAIDYLIKTKPGLFEHCEFAFSGKLDQEPELMPTLKRLREYHHAGYVRLETNFLGQQHLFNWISASDYILCAYPKSFMGWSGFLADALLLKRPVLISDHSFFKDFMHSTGYDLVHRVESHKDLANSIIRAYEARRTPEYDRWVDLGTKFITDYASQIPDRPF
ncbi:MAG: hypothetical protein AAFY98_02355 [Verrucomicrobiota bacterium]